MQNILYFNTIFQGVNIILQLDGKSTIEEQIISDKQSEVLIHSIEKVLKSNNLKYEDIIAFTSIVGPGNFTGIKTSLSVLKALQISTNAKIVTCNVFEIISFNLKYDIIMLDMGIAKYFIKENNIFYSIYKKDLDEFLKITKNKTIITNDQNVCRDNIIYSDFTNKKWIDLVSYKIQNEILTSDIKAIYIEEAGITKRKK
jgi:tRNA A37 threonylcarbamoyladenosine modification protein TsaB